MPKDSAYIFRYKWHVLALALLFYGLLWCLSWGQTANVVLKPLVPAGTPSLSIPISLPYLVPSQPPKTPAGNYYRFTGQLELSSLSTADTLVIRTDNCPKIIMFNGMDLPGLPNFTRWQGCGFDTGQFAVPLKKSNLVQGVNTFNIVIEDIGVLYGIDVALKSVLLKKSLIVVVPALFVILMGTALGFSRRSFSRGNAMAAGLLLMGLCAIAQTFDTLSQTYDEPAHIGPGMQWWDKGEYTYEYMHMPLARIAGTALLYLADITPQGDYRGDFIAVGNRVLNANNAYTHNLTLARLGMLPFYLLAGCIVFLWSRRLYGEKAALLSLFLYVISPMLAAHAGLVATDYTYTAMFITSLYAFVLWLETPGLILSLFLGVSAGLMLLSKVSALVQFPVAAIMILEFHMYNCMKTSASRPPYRRYAQTFLTIIFPVTALLVDAFYFFDNFHGLGMALKEASSKNDIHQAIWLFGPMNNVALWYYFPVAFFFKNPLPFLALAATGTVLSLRRYAHLFYQHRALYPLIAAFAVIAASTISHINIGSRHVLPAFMLLTIPAGYGLSRLIASQQRNCRIVAGALILWQLISFVRIAPDYLIYMNEFASLSAKPVLLDTDLDWGQDLLRLKAVIQDKQIKELTICYFGDADFNRVLGIKTYGCPLNDRDSNFKGWAAVSTYFYEVKDKYDKLKGQEYTQVGNVMRLYYIKP